MATKRVLRPKKAVKNFLNLILLSMSVFMLYTVGTEAYTTIRLKQQLSIAQSQLNGLETENATLTQQKEKLLDPDYVRSYARAAYMLSKEGEQIFYLPKADDSSK
ncbi:MAG: septum formation initiator family protein [Erysipelotrichaceae bacterium]